MFINLILYEVTFLKLHYKNKSKIMSLSHYSYKLPENLQKEGYHLNRATNKKPLFLRRAVINFKHLFKTPKGKQFSQTHSDLLI